MSYVTGRRGDSVVVGVGDRLVVGNRQALKQAVLDEIGRGETKFVIDFTGTTYLDSSGLGALVSLQKKIRDQGGQLRLVNLNDDLRTLFELTRLDSLFRLGGADGGDGAEGGGVRAPLRPSPREGGAGEMVQ